MKFVINESQYNLLRRTGIIEDLFKKYVDDDEFISNLFKEIMAIAIDRKLKVVPIFPKIVLFFKKNPVYKELLPPGIRI